MAGRALLLKVRVIGHRRVRDLAAGFVQRQILEQQ
jgi:hypothetical protein